MLEYSTLVCVCGSLSTHHTGVGYFQYYYFWQRNREKYYPSTVPYEVLDKQMEHEKEIAIRNMAKMALLMLPFTFGVTQGWSKTYYNIDDYGKCEVVGNRSSSQAGLISSKAS